MATSTNFDEALVKIADDINKNRRQELIKIFNDKGIFNNLREIKSQGIYDKGNKSKSMRKIASMPIEVDLFFSKVYGKDYFKDPDFFKKYAPEWLVVDVNKL